MRRALAIVILVILLASWITSAVFIRKAVALEPFYVKDLIQITDGTSFNRPGSLVQNPNGSFLLYSACYDTMDQKHHLEVSFSHDGSVWTSPQRLPLSPSSLYPSAIRDRDGKYWLAWEHQSDTSDSILIASSSNGFDWTVPVHVSIGINSRPSLMQDKNGVYWVAYEDNSFGPEDIIVRNSTDGVNWSTPLYVTERGDDYCDLMASITQDSNGTYWILMARIAPVWDGGSRIWSSHSQDGITWSPPVKIETGMESFFPHLVQDSSGSYVVVWMEFCYSASGKDNIWISRSDDFTYWETPQRLTDNEENSLLTCLLVSADGYYVVYDVWKDNEQTIWMMTVEEAPTPPIARFTYSPQPCLLEGEMTFDASASYDVDGQIISHQWDFGDGSTAEGLKVTYSYSSAGNFTVTLTVIDNDGRAAETTQMLWVDIESAFRGPIVISIQGARTVAAQGVTVDLSVELENKGFVTETYDLILLADTEVIDTFENITQPGHALTKLSTLWDTTQFARGFHTIDAQIINRQGETVVQSNNLEICVSLLGDVDGNFHVDIYDVVLIAGVYGLHSGASHYNANCDLDGDGDIDIFDIVAAAGNYSKSW